MGSAFCCHPTAGAASTSTPLNLANPFSTTHVPHCLLSLSHQQHVPLRLRIRFSQQQTIGSSGINKTESRQRRRMPSRSRHTLSLSLGDISDNEEEEEEEHPAKKSRQRQLHSRLDNARPPYSTAAVGDNTDVASGYSSQDGVGSSATISSDGTALPTCRQTGDDADAERMFAVGRALHLRRHRSPASREAALRLFRDSMRLRPAWKETDSKLSVDSGIDDVFAAFSFEHDHRRGHSNSNSNSNGGGVAGESAAAVGCLRAALAAVGYTASRVLERFWPAAGLERGQRLPGPYFLRKNFDHTHVRRADRRQRTHLF